MMRSENSETTLWSHLVKSNGFLFLLSVDDVLVTVHIKMWCLLVEFVKTNKAVFYPVAAPLK